MAGRCPKYARQIVFWTCMFATASFIVNGLLCVTTFGRLESFYSADVEQNNVLTPTQEEVITTTQGSVFMGFLACLGYALVAVATLLPRFLCGLKTKAGFSFGMLLTATLYSAPIFLFTGLSLMGTRGMARDFWESMVGWSATDTRVMITTAIWSFVDSGLCLVFVVILLCNSAAFAGVAPDESYTDLEKAGKESSETASEPKGKGKNK